MEEIIRVKVKRRYRVRNFGHIFSSIKVGVIGKKTINKDKKVHSRTFLQDKLQNLNNINIGYYRYLLVIWWVLNRLQRMERGKMLRALPTRMRTRAQTRNRNTAVEQIPRVYTVLDSYPPPPLSSWPEHDHQGFTK